MITIYGIKNCDTMKKAFQWFQAEGLDYDFHDYKKLGADESVLRAAIAQHGWDKVINRRGTTWRKLPDDVKSNMDDGGAIAAALDNPSIIKRPLVVDGDATILGFDADAFAALRK